MVFYVIYFKAQQRKEVLDGVPKKIEAMTTPVVKEEERGEMAKEVDHHVKTLNSLVQKDGRVSEHKTVNCVTLANKEVSILIPGFMKPTTCVYLLQLSQILLGVFQL